MPAPSDIMPNPPARPHGLGRFRHCFKEIGGMIEGHDWPSGRTE